MLPQLQRVLLSLFAVVGLWRQGLNSKADPKFLMYHAEFLALLPLSPAGVTGVHHHVDYPYFILSFWVAIKTAPEETEKFLGSCNYLHSCLFGAKPDLKVPGMDIILISFLI